MADKPDILMRIGPGSTGYTTGNDAGGLTFTVPSGCNTVNICGAVDAVAFPILRLNAATNINLNNGSTLAASSAFTFAYQVCTSDGVCSIRFSANCNILHLLVTMSGS